MRRLLCAFLAFAFCTAALSVECPIGYTPAQYIQLEYLESTGTQYIDTGVYGTEKTYASVKARVTTEKLGQLFGYFNNANATNNFTININMLTTSNGGSRFGSQETPSNNVLHASANGKIHVWETSQNGLIEDGILKHSWNISNNFVTASLYLGKANGSTTMRSFAIYECIIKENDVLVRNFIPVMRLSDGKPGMYDKVSGRFFTNQGGGEFIAGPEVPTEFMNFNKCNPCPPNTYKDFVGDGECTPCPDTLISPSGSKSVSECGRVLHIGDKIYHMKSVKQTSPSLHIRDENGNVWYGNLYSEQE